MAWKRFRSDDNARWLDREDWPAAEGVHEVIVYDPCNGFEIWRWTDQFTPPGAHWAPMPKPPREADEAHRQRIAAHYNGKSPLEGN